MTENIKTLHILGYLFLYLPIIVAAVAAASFGLSMSGLRGKIWLAIGASSAAVFALWWGWLNLRSFCNDSTDSFEGFQKALRFGPIFSFLFSGLAWPCMLLFAVSNGRRSPDYGWVLFSPNGRIGRQHYWISTIALMAAAWGSCASYYQESAEFLRMSSASSYIHDADRHALQHTKVIIAEVVMWTWTVISIWPQIAVQVKRWHDRGKPGAMVLINLLPIVGQIWSLIELGMQPGTVGANEYGPDPLEGDDAAMRPKTAAPVPPRPAMSNSLPCPICQSPLQIGLIRVGENTCPNCLNTFIAKGSDAPSP